MRLRSTLLNLFLKPQIRKKDKHYLPIATLLLPHMPIHFNPVSGSISTRILLIGSMTTYKLPKLSGLFLILFISDPFLSLKLFLDYPCLQDRYWLTSAPAHIRAPQDPIPSFMPLLLARSQPQLPTPKHRRQTTYQVYLNHTAQISQRPGPERLTDLRSTHMN